MFFLAFSAGLFLLTAVTVLWLLSLLLRDASIVDVFWGLGFVAVYWIGFALVHSQTGDGQPIPPRHILVGLLVTIWGLRLAGHILAPVSASAVSGSFFCCRDSFCGSFPGHFWPSSPAGVRQLSAPLICWRY